MDAVRSIRYFATVDDCRYNIAYRTDQSKWGAVCDFRCDDGYSVIVNHLTSFGEYPRVAGQHVNIDLCGWYRPCEGCGNATQIRIGQYNSGEIEAAFPCESWWCHGCLFSQGDQRVQDARIKSGDTPAY